MEEANSFSRYLAAKKTADDRALNGYVSQKLAHALSTMENMAALEIGAGIGTMAERLHEKQLLPVGSTYTAIDAQPENMAAARERLRPLSKSFVLELETIDLFDFIAREQGRRYWDLLIAHAFLDLVDLQSTLPGLFTLLRPGGFFYFTINFDGETILHPEIDRELDRLIIDCYHQTMDTRKVYGRPSGDSQTGRKLFMHLPSAGAQILAAGSSDWVVYPGSEGYEADEAYFLHFIINTIAGALDAHPELNRSYFEAWIAQRHMQITAGTLVYIAHQLDFFGRWPG